MRGVLLAVALSACVSALPRAPQPRLTTVRIARFSFAPSEIDVHVNDTIVWVNEDAFAHTSTADSAGWASPELGAGRRFAWVARHPGRFAYRCAAHPTMRGVVSVRGADK